MSCSFTEDLDDGSIVRVFSTTMRAFATKMWDQRLREPMLPVNIRLSINWTPL